LFQVPAPVLVENFNKFAKLNQLLSKREVKALDKIQKIHQDAICSDPVTFIKYIQACSEGDLLKKFRYSDVGKAMFKGQQPGIDKFGNP